MKIVYKKIKVIAPHCGDCGEKMREDYSTISPYHCRCGYWKFDPESGEYYLIGDEK